MNKLMDSVCIKQQALKHISIFLLNFLYQIWPFFDQSLLLLLLDAFQPTSQMYSLVSICVVVVPVHPQILRG